MRLRRAVRNSISSVGSYLLLAILGLVVRKLFLMYFDLSYLGYEGLFGSTFTILSVMEMGAGSMFTYLLYSAIEKEDREEISVIMSMFRQLYQMIGLLVIGVGLILYVCLPYIVTEPVENWTYVRIIFLVQMLVSVSTYFLAYRRVLLLADQCEYLVIRIETFFRILGVLIKIAVIVWLQNYLAYILVTFFTNVLANLAVYSSCKRRYPYLKKVRVILADYKEKKIDKEMRSLIIHKLSATIYSSADNIIISALCGIRTVGLFSNYTLINTNVMNLVVKTLQPLEASVGNKVNASAVDENISFYKGYDLFCRMLALFTFVGFSVMLQPVLAWFYGDAYLLPYGMVLAMAANNYIAVRQYAVTAYRNALGHYDIDRNSRIASAVCNIVISIVAGSLTGISGILFATAVGHCFIWYGRVKTVGMIYLQDRSFVRRTFVQEIPNFLLGVAEGVLCVGACMHMPVSFGGILGRLAVCFTVPNLLNLCLFRKAEGMETIRRYATQIIAQVRRHKDM